mmetsp:Transcript_60925/g.175547  ORF Transcript_60925/g.175547 Transcript_60925/m.175547 type:complete len:104 (+) Transcript_60925:208-519(+)
MLKAAEHEKYPHFKDFVDMVFDEVDEDLDGVLEAGEAQEFLVQLRAQIARAVYGQGDEEDLAVKAVYDLLEEHKEGGLSLERLREAASSVWFPELEELVEELI